MLRKIRLTFAMICFVLITLLFLDFTGTLHGWFGWLAKIQFLPAVLALNVGVILFLVILTLVCGRIYCSVICPLGVFQDILAWLGRQPKKRRKLPYSYSPALSWLRYGVLGVFIIALIAGIGSLAALLAPYSAYGRIANNLFQPIWQWGNNLLAYLAERADSYAFYETDVWLKSLPTFIIAAATLAVLVVLAGRNGRTYCNTICPVGTVLGFLSRTQRGVADLYDLYQADSAFMKGAAIADKVIGKGAAALMVLGGFKTVYADIISTPALALLCKAGIETTFAQEVPHIINRDKTGWCPLETACMELNTVEEMYPVIQNFISRIRAK